MALFDCPVTSPCITWRSRWVRLATRAAISADTASLFEPLLLSASAVSIMPISRSSSNGFSRKSSAPSFIASTARGTSPWPVMTMTGSFRGPELSRRSSSMPSMPGTASDLRPPMYFADGDFAQKLLDEEAAAIDRRLSELEAEFRASVERRATVVEWRSARTLPAPYLLQQARAADILVIGARPETLVDPGAAPDPSDLL